MKNIILGIIGVFVTIYTLLIGLNVLTIQSHKNLIDKHLSRIIKNILENEFHNGDASAVKQMLQEEIENSISRNAKLLVEIQEIDLQKGILSVKVAEQIYTVTGKQKEIVVEKTVIMEQAVTYRPKATVTFLIDGDLYKEYEITKGERCPLPKIPIGNFIGWMEYGDTQKSIIKEIGQVMENRVYVAIFES